MDCATNSLDRRYYFHYHYHYDYCHFQKSGHLEPQLSYKIYLNPLLHDMVVSYCSTDMFDKVVIDMISFHDHVFVGCPEAVGNAAWLGCQR